MVVFGIILSLPGTVVGLPDAAEPFGLTLADRGALISTLFVGLLIGSLLPGPVVDLLGAGERYAVNAGILFGTLLTPAQAGASVLPAAVGLVAEAFGVGAGLSIVAVNGIVIALARRHVHGARP